MERITAYPFEEVTPRSPGGSTLSDAARQSLPDSELAVDVTRQRAERRAEPPSGSRSSSAGGAAPASGSRPSA